jgi:predicted GNAT family N-acyltransferase
MLSAEYRFVDRLSEAHARDLHSLYQNEWWSKGRTEDDVRVVLEHSDLLVGIVSTGDDRLAAFARVLTDRIFKAVIFDVIVAPGHRDRRLGRALMERLCGHPDLARVRHVELYCRPELVPFYEQWGFTQTPPDVVYMRRTPTPRS